MKNISCILLDYSDEKDDSNSVNPELLEVSLAQKIICPKSFKGNPLQSQ